MEPVVPPPPSGSGLSVRYGLRGYRGLTFLEPFGTGCRDAIYRCYGSRLSPHPLPKLRSEMPAPAGLGLAGQQIVCTGEENPPARTPASNTPSALRVLPGIAGDGKVSPCHTGSHPSHAPAAPGKAPDQVVHKHPALRPARAAAKDPTMATVRVRFEDGPEAIGFAKGDASAQSVPVHDFKSQGFVKAISKGVLPALHARGVASSVDSIYMFTMFLDFGTGG